MSLLNLTHKRLIKQINDANGLTLAYNQVNFSKPKVNTLTDRSTANTMIRTSPSFTSTMRRSTSPALCSEKAAADGAQTTGPQLR